MDRKSSIIAEELSFQQLVNRVGGKGKYQIHIFIIFSFIWIITGVTVLQAPFLFHQPIFDLSNTNFDNICQLSSQDRKQYYAQNIIKSVNTEFGPFVCEEESKLGYIKSSVYLGGLVGLIFFSFIMDNQGRRTSMLSSWGATTFGSFLITFSSNIYIICLGLFLTGASLSAIRLTISIINQIFQKTWRQKCSVILQLFLAIGGLVISASYYLSYNWRTAYSLTVFLPSLIIMVLMVYYLQQSPAFLLITDKKKAIQSLNRIAQINIQKKNVLTLEDFNMLEHQISTHQAQFRSVTFKDVLTLPSLRSKTILLSIILFCSSFLFYAPIFIIDKLDINIFVSMIVISSGQFITVPIASLIVQKVQRKKMLFFCFSLSALCTGILALNQSSQGGILSLMLIFGSKLSICFYYTIIFLYGIQLLPVRARGMSFGAASAFGNIASAIQGTVIMYFVIHGYNLMLFLTCLAGISIIAANYLPETLNQPLLEEIQEFQLQKKLITKSTLEEIQLVDLKQKDYPEIQITPPKKLSYKLKENFSAQTVTTLKSQQF